MYKLTMEFESYVNVDSLKNLVEEFCQKNQSDPDIEYLYPMIENESNDSVEYYDPVRKKWE